MRSTEPYVLCRCASCGAASAVSKEVFEDHEGTLVARGLCTKCGELVSFTYVPNDYSKMITSNRVNGKFSGRKPHYY